jgi:4'-phosphopantetheinyl transferase
MLPFPNPRHLMKLCETEVHLWQIQLANQEWGLQYLRSLLSPDEVQRADRFYFEKHKRRFIVARAATRVILATYVGRAPHELAFSYGAKGKPELSLPQNSPKVQFNLSHSEDLALLAVTLQHRVGVDIEFIKHDLAIDEIATRCFSEVEIKILRALPQAERTKSFYSWWTRKEAFIKAIGKGLSIPLESFSVNTGPNIIPSLSWVDLEPEEISNWQVHDISAPHGYAAALVVEGRGHDLRQWRWNWGSEWRSRHSGL